MPQQRIPTVTLFLSFKTLAVGGGALPALPQAIPGAWGPGDQGAIAPYPAFPRSPVRVAAVAHVPREQALLVFSVPASQARGACSALLGNGPSVPFTTRGKEGCFT